jgi:hypothetical protein
VLLLLNEGSEVDEDGGEALCLIKTSRRRSAELKLREGRDRQQRRAGKGSQKPHLERRSGGAGGTEGKRK